MKTKNGKSSLTRILWRHMTAAVAAVGILAPVAGHAFVITSDTGIGETFTIKYSLAAGADDGNGNTNITGQEISGEVLFTLLSFDINTDVIELGLKATNTSADNGVQVGLQKLAFGTAPDATGVEFVDADDGEFISATLDVSPEVQNAVKPLVLDVQAETGNGAKRLLLEGEWDEFVLNISFGDLTNVGIDFNPFSSKWQTGEGSYEFAGGPGTTTEEQVPEPSTLLLSALGLMGIGFYGRRRRRN